MGEGSMNKAFSECTTSTAFLLNLSKLQCNTLLRLSAHEAKHGKQERGGDVTRWSDRSSPASSDIVHVYQLTSLCAKGLVFWFTDHKGEPRGFGGLTKAGELVAQLLVEAGLTIESTNTVSVLKKLAA